MVGRDVTRTLVAAAEPPERPTDGYTLNRSVTGNMTDIVGAFAASVGATLTDWQRDVVSWAYGPYSGPSGTLTATAGPAFPAGMIVLDMIEGQIE